jgi:hypothetical protein
MNGAREQCATREQALQTHGAYAGRMSRWRTGRAKVLAVAVLLGILWLWLGSGSGNLQPAAHHFVRVDGTQVRGCPDTKVGIVTRAALHLLASAWTEPSCLQCAYVEGTRSDDQLLRACCCSSCSTAGHSW